MSAWPSSELITEVGCSDHWALKSPPSSTGARPPRPSRVRSTRCSCPPAESATGNCRTTALNAGCSVSILHVSACWPPSRRVTVRIAADEPARRRTASSAPVDGRVSDWAIAESVGATELNSDPARDRAERSPSASSPSQHSRRGCCSPHNPAATTDLNDACPVGPGGLRDTAAIGLLVANLRNMIAHDHLAQDAALIIHAVCFLQNLTVIPTDVESA